MNRRSAILCALLWVSLPADAGAFWRENFDQYAAGTSLHHLNGWEGWWGNPDATAYVCDLYAHSHPNSCVIEGASDLVHPFVGYTTGTWQFATWMYLPAEFSGHHYLLLFNRYRHDESSNWSVVVRFEDGLVVNEGVTGGSLPWILGEWVLVRITIDLYDDRATFYYGDQVLYAGTWTQEVTGGGARELAAVDLFADFSTPVYYDDMWIGSPVPVEQKAWGDVKALFR